MRFTVPLLAFCFPVLTASSTSNPATTLATAAQLNTTKEALGWPARTLLGVDKSEGSSLRHTNPLLGALGLLLSGATTTIALIPLLVPSPSFAAASSTSNPDTTTLVTVPANSTVQDTEKKGSRSIWDYDKNEGASLRDGNELLATVGALAGAIVLYDEI